MKPHVQAALNAVLTERSTGTRRKGTPAVSDWDSLRLHRGVLDTPDGSIPVERIGKGMFATVYRATEPPRDVYAFTDDDIYDKEIAASVYEDDKTNPHVPAVERFGHTHDQSVWKMPHYRTPLRKSDSPEAWATYKVMEQCRDAATDAPNSKQRSGYQINEQALSCARLLVRNKQVLDALEAFKNTAANYGEDYVFEFAPRNLATDAKGNLVFLDVLFDEAERKKRLRRK